MTSPLYQIPVRRLNGRAGTLAPFEGTVLLVVNVASYCVLTQQYADLESLQRAYSGRGFSVLGFPANDFAHQEPGSSAEIEEFCTANYNVRFPMFEKIVAKGPNRHPLYSHLIARRPIAVARPGSHLLQHLLRGRYLPAPPAHGELLWNFEKFLISRQGDVVARFAPDVTVDQPVILEAIEQQLQQPGQRQLEQFPLPLSSSNAG